MMLIQDNNVTERKYCNKINNGYEFISDRKDTMLTLRQCTSRLNYQSYIYYLARINIRINDAWVKTDEIKTYNTIDDFINILNRTPGFLKAAADFKNLK